MKRYKIRVLLLVILAASWTGCNKKLNTPPSGSEVDGNIIFDAQSATTALNGVYYTFSNSGNDQMGIPSVLWFQLFQNISSELSGLVTYPYGSDDYSSHTYTPITTPLFGLDIWTYGSKVVNAANGFIKNITPVANITGKAEMIAEARFLRAFGNSTLLLYYGQYYDTASAYGIVLRSSFVVSDEIVQAREKVGIVYDSVLADLDAAIPDLPSENSAKWYTNAWTAKLLKARVLINRGSPADYAQVVALCNDLITNSPFMLEPNVRDIFQTKGFSSKEVMLGIQPAPNQTAQYSNNVAYTGGVGEIGTDTLGSLFNGDPRSSWMLTSKTDPYYGYPELILTKFYPDNLTPSMKPEAITENCYAFRLTEAYLLEAEALVQSGGDLNQAKTLLKTVLMHAGFTDLSAVDAETTQSGLLLKIVEEEMKSFVGEGGQDWLALRRLPFSQVQQLIPGIQDKSRLILPIPAAEMTTNSKMVQNPNY